MEGMDDEMIIFQPKFVRNNMNFSRDYLSNYFQYNDTRKPNEEFVIQYDKVISPRRWHKTNSSLDPSYTTKEKWYVYGQKERMGDLFKPHPSQIHKPFEVFSSNKHAEKQRRMFKSLQKGFK